MGTIAFQITSFTIVYSTVYSDADQRKYQSSASLAFVHVVWGIHRRPVNSPHKWPVTRKIFPFDDVIMISGLICPTSRVYIIISIYFHGWRKEREVNTESGDGLVTPSNKLAPIPMLTTICHAVRRYKDTMKWGFMKIGMNMMKCVFTRRLRTYLLSMYMITPTIQYSNTGLFSTALATT